VLRSLCATQFLIDCAVGSNARASSSGVRPACTNSTNWRRNSGALARLDFDIVDSSNTNVPVSTKPRQLQMTDQRETDGDLRIPISWPLGWCGCADAHTPHRTPAAMSLSRDIRVALHRMSAAVSGIDSFREVSRIVVVGWPAQLCQPVAMEKLGSCSSGAIYFLQDGVDTFLTLPYHIRQRPMQTMLPEVRDAASLRLASR
jgi:hypothetical protein